ncbi:MAG: hypothetical protein ABIN89_25230 [Chitinophagaceae bacterium]
MAPPPDAILMQFLFAPLLQQAVCVTAKLKIADLLVHPKTVTELASLTQTHEDTLNRVLRMLISVGIFNKNNEDKFELTPLASLLRSDLPNSMYSFAVKNSSGIRVYGEIVETAHAMNLLPSRTAGFTSTC